MTYTPIGHPAVDRPEVSRAAFGYIVVDNLTDLDSRVTTNASALTGKADKTTTVSAGTGLTGGGDLSANRTLAVAYGTAASTATQGNDTRVVNAVQTSRQILAGTGLTGGGDLSADRTLTVAYGNTSTTAASGDRALALESGNGVFARQDASVDQTLTAATWTAVTFATATTTNANVTVAASNTSFTMTKAGRWLVIASSGSKSTMASGVVNLCIGSASGTPGTQYGTQSFNQVSGSGQYVQTSSMFKVTSSQTVFVDAYSTGGGALNSTSTNIQLMYLGA